MFGDLLTYLFFALFVYLLFKVFIKGVIPGFLDGLKVVIKIVLFIVLLPIVICFKLITLPFNLGKNKISRPVGVGNRTITITDQFKDRKGRTVRIKETIDLGTKAFTKRDLNRIR